MLRTRSSGRSLNLAMAANSSEEPGCGFYYSPKHSEDHTRGAGLIGLVLRLRAGHSQTFANSLNLINHEYPWDHGARLGPAAVSQHTPLISSKKWAGNLKQNHSRLDALRLRGYCLFRVAGGGGLYYAKKDINERRREQARRGIRSTDTREC
jgi:hypothetical protein